MTFSLWEERKRVEYFKFQLRVKSQGRGNGTKSILINNILFMFIEVQV